ncbi:MAG: MaoC family dehydratase [Rubritepida sp.]|nr:MaoC family dehydratase [Rubritepida sp.]
MIDIETPAALAEWVGRKLGTSDWVTVDQRTIDLFAEATGDHQWIHVDVERAAREMPGGKTIAHGFLTLSLLPRLAPMIYRVVRRSRAINYGSNKVRFTAPVPSGSRVRLHLTVQAVEPIAGGVRLTTHNEMEVEGNSRPCLVAETMAQVYD